MSLAPRIDKFEKNYVINGNFDFWQRGTSFNLVTQTYTADRFVGTFGTGGVTISRSTDVPSGSKSIYSMQLVGAANAASNPRIFQRCESIFTRDLVGKQVTFFAKVKVTDATAAPITLSFYTPNTQDTWSFVTQTGTDVIITPTQNQWVNIIHTITVPAEASRGFAFQLMRQTNSSIVTTTLFHEIMLLEGAYTSMPTDYIRAGRDYVEELQLCQRYYEKSYDINTTPGTPTTDAGSIFFRAALTATQTFGSVIFTSKKRSAPTITVYSVVTGASGVIRNVVAGADVAATTFSIGQTAFTVASNASVTDQHAITFQYAADSEL